MNIFPGDIGWRVLQFFSRGGTKENISNAVSSYIFNLGLDPLSFSQSLSVIVCLCLVQMSSLISQPQFDC